jgi:hypothetical protein
MNFPFKLAFSILGSWLLHFFVATAIREEKEKKRGKAQTPSNNQTTPSHQSSQVRRYEPEGGILDKAGGQGQDMEAQVVQPRF